jgi:hypothetical protein
MARWLPNPFEQWLAEPKLTDNIHAAAIAGHGYKFF